MELKKKFIKISGLSGILLPILTITLLILALQQASWFSWTGNAISDLGRSSSGILCFNFGLIIIGILLLIFSIGLYFYLGGARVGPTMLAISSIYFIGIGFFPLPNPNHIDFSGLFFIAFPLAFFVLGLQIFRNKCDFICKMGIFAIIIGAFSLLAPIFLIFYNGIAIPEFIILTSAFIWCFAFGFKMLISKSLT